MSTFKFLNYMAIEEDFLIHKGFCFKYFSWETFKWLSTYKYIQLSNSRDKQKISENNK